MREDVTYLAADEREGRGPGTEGDRRGGRLHLLRLQVGRAQARARRRRLLPAVLDRARRPWAGDQELAFTAPDADATAEAQDRFHRRWRSASASLEGVPIVFAGYGITAKDGRAQARLRRLRRDRRQGQGRADPPPRAAARRRQEPVRRQATTSIRDLPAQGDQRLPARGRRGPARQRRRRQDKGRTTCLHFGDAGGEQDQSPRSRS